MSSNEVPRPRARRRDAERNRARVLDAAKTVFAARGAEADIREIARSAGVGVGTLYRHFPTKDALAEAVIDDAMRRWAQTAADIAAVKDPWEGLCAVIEDGLDRHVAHRGLLADAIGMAGESLPPARLYNTLIHPTVTDLVDRAHHTGALRPDIDADDILYAMVGIGRVIEFSADTDPHRWRRHLHVLLDGLQGDCKNIGVTPIKECGPDDRPSS